MKRTATLSARTGTHHIRMPPAASGHGPAGTHLTSTARRPRTRHHETTRLRLLPRSMSRGTSSRVQRRPGGGPGPRLGSSPGPPTASSPRIIRNRADADAGVVLDADRDKSVLLDHRWCLSRTSVLLLVVDGRW
jgi:hypothetical protein